MLVNKVTQHRKLLLCSFDLKVLKLAAQLIFFAIYSYLLLKNDHIYVIKRDKRDLSHVSNHAVLQSGR